MQPLDLIKTARRLVGKQGAKRPRQSDLKRAISTVYYALFHALCRNCADCLIGKTRASRSAPAWSQAYRAVEHGYAKHQCQNKSIIKKFPKKIEDFANLFRDLQLERHQADYDHNSQFRVSDVRTSTDVAELAIRNLNRAKSKDLRAFAAWTAMKKRVD